MVTQPIDRDTTPRGTTPPLPLLEPHRAIEPAPRRVGRYRVLAWLGGGGMGEVWVGHDDLLQRPIAIKRLRSDRAPTEARRRRLALEAQLNARLSHPNVVQVYDFVTEGGVDHIVTEYVEGRSLDAAASSGPLSLPRTLAILVDVCRGLGAAHRHGIVHRDLKLENVLVGPEDVVKIADFGLAALDEADGGEPGGGGFAGGTIRSMSPEQSLGLETDARSDLFSFGVLVYELLSGLSPFAGPRAEATLDGLRSRAHRALVEVVPAIPIELSRLVDRLLEKAPELRPASAGEVEAKLVQILSRLPLDVARSQATSVVRRTVAIAYLRLRHAEPELEDVARRVFAWHRRVRERVAAYEGHVVLAAGDEALVCLGFPRSHASNCQLAAELVAELSTDPVVGASGALGAAIDLGTVAVVPGLEPTLVGPPLEVAASIGRAAAAGELLVTARALGVLSRSFRLSLHHAEPAGLVYRVEEPLDWEAHADGGTLVGRDDELAVLRSAEARAFEGRSEALAWVGPAGIGKSALVRALVGESSAERRLVVRAAERTCYSVLAPFLALLRRLPELCGDDGQIERAAIVRCSSGSASTHRDRVAVVATVGGVAEAEDQQRLAATTPRERHTFLAEQLGGFLLELLAPHATLLVVEDLHWLDSASRQVVQVLAKGCRTRPLCLVVTSRPHAAIASLDAFERHELGPLRIADAARIVDASRRGASLPADVVRTIVERADGVPLLLEELTHFAVDRVIGSSLDAKGALERIPTTLHDSVLERLQELAPATRHVAEIAASVGMRVEAELLERVARLAPKELETHVGVLGREGLLQPVPFADGRAFAFRHALMRDAVYEAQDATRCSSNHRAILAEIGASFPQWRTERPELLAVQYLGAGEHREAATCWLDAGRRATAGWSPSVARDHFEAALAAIGRVDDEVWARSTELDVRKAHSAVLTSIVGWGSPVANANNARIRELVATSEPLEWTNVYLSCLGDYVTGNTAELSAKLGWLALRAEGEDVPADGGLSRYLLWSVRGMVSVHAGYLSRAHEELARALALRDGLLPILRSFPLPEPMLIPRAYLSWVRLLQGDLAEAWAYQRAEEASFELGTREHVAACSFGVPVALVAGDVEGARERAALVAAAVREPDQHTHLASMALGIVSLRSSGLALSLSELDARVEQMQQGFDEWRGGHMRTGALLFTAIRAEACVALALRRVGEELGTRAAGHARRLVDEMLALVSDDNELDRYYASEAHRLHAELLGLEGHAEAAAAAREQARWQAALVEGRRDGRPLLLEARIDAEAG